MAIIKLGGDSGGGGNVLSRVLNGCRVKGWLDTSELYLGLVGREKMALDKLAALAPQVILPPISNFSPCLVILVIQLEMPLEKFQVNTKFLNTLLDEWSKFFTDVKLVKDLHTTNIDQLHAYLQQHERQRLLQANYVLALRLGERNQRRVSLQFVTPYQTQQFTTNQSTPLSITYPSNEYQSSIHNNIYSPQPSIPQSEYAPTSYQQQQTHDPDSSLVVLVFQKRDDPINAINHMMSFLTAVVTS
ncbi:hypothetical protein Tco_0963015 [Tanacetum coccineum]